MATRKPDPTKLGLDNYKLPDRFGDWLGYKIVRISRERHVAEVSLKIREDHLSSAGRVHGGVVSAFIDFACGAAVFSTLGPKDFCSTVELKVNYLKPVHLGDDLRALSRVIYRGNRLCVLHAFLYRNREKQPVAMASATFNVITANGKK